MRFRLPSLLLFLVAALFLAATVDAQDGEGAAPLRVALTGKYPPMSFYDENGELAGFDVEVSRAIAERLDRPCEIVTTEWAGILAGLQAGRYDAIIGSMAITPEREEAVLFSKPYYISGAQLFVRREDAARFKSIDDLAGSSVGAVTGTTFQHTVEAEHPGVEVRTYQGEPDIFQDIRAGRIDGFVTDKLVGLYNAKGAGLDVVAAGPLLYEERIGIPVTKKNAALRGDIDEALAAMESDGSLDALKAKWFGAQATAARVDVDAGFVARRMLWGFGRTLFAAAVAIVVGFGIAIPFGVALKSAPRIWRVPLQFANDAIRGTPLLVQLLFIYAGAPQLGGILADATGIEVLRTAFRLGPMQAGVLALTLNAAAFMAEVVRSGLLAVPPGQTTGALALGLSRVQAFRHVVWPQAFRVMIPPLMNSVVALLKDTALLSVISVAEVITEAQKLISVTYKPMTYYAIAAAMFFAVAWPLMKFSQRLEERIRRRGYQENA